MIWQHGEEKLKDFLKELNKCHPSIKFTSNYSKEKIDLHSPCSSDTGRGLKRSSSKTRSDDSDVFLQQMKEFDNRIINSIEEKKEVVQVCEETSFCNSLIPVLQGFSVKKKRLAKVKINELLYNIEFCSEYEDI